VTDLDLDQAERTALKILQVHEQLEGERAVLFKAHGLSGPQYNVLRILRGAGDEDPSCQEVGARLLTRVPDVTRLLDRLEQRDLITRWRCADDRRVVRTRITPSGLTVLTEIDRPLRDLIARQFGGLGPRQLTQLDRLLGLLLCG
jgi:DNA-binding MarR family transcriptional regulator